MEMVESKEEWCEEEEECEEKREGNRGKESIKCSQRIISSAG